MRQPGYPKSTTVTAGGTASIEFTPSGVYSWTVDQVSTEYDAAPIGCVCKLRRNGSQITPMVASGSVADGAPSITLNVGDRLTIEWTGATPGDVVKAWITYDDGQPG